MIGSTKAKMFNNGYHIERRIQTYNRSTDIVIGIKDKQHYCIGTEVTSYSNDRPQYRNILEYDSRNTAYIAAEGLLQRENKIRGILISPYEKPREIEFLNTLREKQKIVDGLIDAIYYNQEIDVVVNDEYLYSCVPNRVIGNTPICGNILLLQHNDEGEYVTMRQDNVEKLLNEFSEVEYLTVSNGLFTKLPAYVYTYNDKIVATAINEETAKTTEQNISNLGLKTEKYKRLLNETKDGFQWINTKTGEIKENVGGLSANKDTAFEHTDNETENRLNELLGEAEI